MMVIVKCGRNISVWKDTTLIGLALFGVCVQWRRIDDLSFVSEENIPLDRLNPYCKPKLSHTNRCAAIKAQKGHIDSNVIGNQIAHFKLWPLFNPHCFHKDCLHFLEGSLNYFLLFWFFTNSGKRVKSAGFPVPHREIFILGGPNAKLKYFILKNFRAANDKFTLISLASKEILVWNYLPKNSKRGHSTYFTIVTNFTSTLRI